MKLRPTPSRLPGILKVNVLESYGVDRTLDGTLTTVLLSTCGFINIITNVDEVGKSHFCLKDSIVKATHPWSEAKQREQEDTEAAECET